MKLLFRFGESDDKWNIYATLVSAIYILIFYLFKIPLSSVNLIFISLLAMYNGDLKSKLVFTLFLNMLFVNSFKNNHKQLLISLLAVYLVDKFKQKNNKIVNYIYQNKLFALFIKLSYYIWMIIMGKQYFLMP